MDPRRSSAFQPPEAKTHIPQSRDSIPPTQRNETRTRPGKVAATRRPSTTPTALRLWPTEPALGPEIAETPISQVPATDDALAMAMCFKGICGHACAGWGGVFGIPVMACLPQSRALVPNQEK